MFPSKWRDCGFCFPSTLCCSFHIVYRVTLRTKKNCQRKGYLFYSISSHFLAVVLDISVFSSPALNSPFFWSQYTLCVWKDHPSPLLSSSTKWTDSTSGSGLSLWPSMWPEQWIPLTTVVKWETTPETTPRFFKKQPGKLFCLFL